MISILQQVKHEAFSRGYSEGRNDMRSWRDDEATEKAYWDGYRRAKRENQIWLALTFIVILLVVVLCK